MDFCCSKHMESTLEDLGKQFDAGFSVGFVYQMGMPDSTRLEKKENIEHYVFCWGWAVGRLGGVGSCCYILNVHLYLGKTTNS